MSIFVLPQTPPEVFFSDNSEDHGAGHSETRVGQTQAESGGAELRAGDQ